MYIDTFEKVFTLDDENSQPSSFWNQDMVMLSSESLQADLKVYSTWEPFRERSRDGWLWHAPYRVFRFPTDDSYLLAQKNRKWVVYDPEIRKFHLVANGLRIQSFNFLTDVLKSIYE